MTKTEAIKMLMKHSGVRVLKLAEKMNITHPTAKKLLDDPEKMNGYQRQELANAIGIPREVIDDICNGRYQLEEVAG